MRRGTRRIVVVAWVSAAMAAGAAQLVAAPQEDAVAAARVDHVIVGVADLEAGIEAFEELSGVRPTFGGEHPGIGTHNALVSLGDGVYLELIAPRPGAEVQGAWAGLEGLTGLTPVGWAVGTDDLEAALAELRRAGLETTEPTPGSRVTPSGATLTWSAAGLAEPGPGAVPFLIEWGEDSPHPSTTSPAGCRLQRLELASPEPGHLARLVEALGLDVATSTAEAPGMAIGLECPAGPVTLGS